MRSMAFRLAALLLFGASAGSLAAQGNLAAVGAPANPKVVVTWDR